LYGKRILGELETIFGKSVFNAFQASSRGGTVSCRLAEDRVELQGACVFYLEGSIEIPI